MIRSRRPRARPNPHDADWHERMMARGPQGLARDVWGAKDWNDLQRLAVRLMDAWEAMPPLARIAYAFPNPEDRKRRQ